MYHLRAIRSQGCLSSHLNPRSQSLCDCSCRRPSVSALPPPPRLGQGMRASCSKEFVKTGQFPFNMRAPQNSLMKNHTPNPKQLESVFLNIWRIALKGHLPYREVNNHRKSHMDQNDKLNMSLLKETWFNFAHQRTFSTIFIYGKSWGGGVCFSSVKNSWQIF